MRIIKEKTIIEKCRNEPKYYAAEEPLKAWIFEIKHVSLGNSSELKLKFRTASIINAKRVVFNIKGKDYRLIADIEYHLKILFVVWFGTHDEYDKIDVKKIGYEN